MNSSINKYQTQQVMTASPARLVFMLYDRAILSLREAIAAIEAGQIEARWKANRRAIDIVTHMWSTLDLGRGGEIARNLNDLFNYILSRLPEVDFRNDAAAAREVIGLLEPLRESWQKVAAGETDSGAATAGRPPSNGSYGGQPSADRMPTSLSA